MLQSLSDLGNVVEIVCIGGTQFVQNEPFQIFHRGDVSVLFCFPQGMPCIRRHHSPAVAALRKKLPDIGGTGGAVRCRLTAVVSGSSAGNGHGLQGTVHFFNGVEVGNGKGVVGAAEHGSCFFPVELPDHLGEHLRIGIAGTEKIVHDVGVVCLADLTRLCRL